MSSTNDILEDLATSLAGEISDIPVMPFVIPAAQLLQMDDTPVERIGMSFDGTTSGVVVNTGREFQFESFRVQLFFALADKKGDKELVEAALNDVADLVIAWYKDVRDDISSINSDLLKLELVGKRGITRSSNYYEQYLEFRLLRSI